MINYYQILGISQNASQEEIKAAFKKKAVLFHPDKHQGDHSMEEMFKQINLAHQVLSNASTRSNYDMMLQYGESQPTFERTAYPPNRPPTWPGYKYQRAGRPFVKKQKFTSRENLMGTLYAFLFAFVMAFIIKAGIWINDYYNEQEMIVLLTERRDIFSEAQTSYRLGEYKKSLNMLVDMRPFYRSELDIRDYKDDLLLEIRRRGDKSLKEGNFEEARELYYALEGFSISTTLSFLKKSSKVQIGLGNFQKAVEIYQTLFANGYRSTSFYYEMGSLYENGLKDYGMAQNYYEIGARNAASDYEITIGKAYPIVINANMVPRLHYHIYMKLAQMYIQTGHFQEAIDAVQWTKDIWPDSLINYEIEAKGYRGLGNTSAMKKTLKKAQTIDPSFDID